MNLATALDRSKADVESWRYTDLQKLLATSSTSFPRKRESILSEDKMDPRLRGGDAAIKSNLVFINGVWDKAQSQLGDLPANILQGDASSGYKLTLAGQTCLVTSPIELLFVTNMPGNHAAKLDIELGVSGRLTLIERHVLSPHIATHTLETKIALHPQAKLVHGKIITSGSEHAHIALTKVAIAEGAYYDNFALTKDCKLARNEMDVSLNGKLAQCTLNGAMLVRGHEHVDTTTRITHAAPHGTSREIYKSVVAEKARAVFQGKILVKEGAQKTDGHQLSRALLLSDQAEMDAKPELEIYADDVKCSHGSTVGDLDDEALFYLRARGLNEAEARALLIQGFVGEILDEIHADELRDICRKEVEDWLHDQI